MSKRLKWAPTKFHARAIHQTSTASMAAGIQKGRRAPTSAMAATCEVTSSGESWWLNTTAR